MATSKPDAELSHDGAVVEVVAPVEPGVNDQAPVGEIKVVVVNTPTRFRAGHKFTATPVTLERASLTVQQLSDLKADKHLSVEELPA